MYARYNGAIEDCLRAEGGISEKQLAELSSESRRAGQPLAVALITAGLFARHELIERLAAYCGREYVAELPTEISVDLAALVPSALARARGVLPLRADARQADVICSDPFDFTVGDELTFALGRDVRIFVADPDQVEALVRRVYGSSETVAAAELAESREVEAQEEISIDNLEAMANQAPVVRLVSAILSRAVRDKASDVHFEPFEKEFKVRYRIDGVLHDLPPPPRHLALAVVSRLKVMASLNIAERRLPQDGRIRLAVEGKPIDLRVSTLPTQCGESVVLRVLDASAIRIELSQLGMPGRVAAEVAEVIRRPDGMFLVTGPTGSGKTTTLYGALQAINRPELKLLTVEDPVEYEIEGVMQVPLNPAAGLTFASALRSFLRQDPDVVMVGEIRDLETAQIALQASLTGHLVFSTLHTRDAAEAITRLIDLGAESYLISAALQGVLAQRLARRICPHCRTVASPSVAEAKDLGLTREEIAGRPFFRGAGCPQCHDTGYRGRLGIFEWLRVTDEIRDLIARKAPLPEIRRVAGAQSGRGGLRAEGLRAAFDGQTTIEEVIKYT